VTLKTVLLLAVFAAVDIAASSGFVLIRLVMVRQKVINNFLNVLDFNLLFILWSFHQYSMKDYQFPSEMRVPSAITEYQQLTAFSALRFAALQVNISID
jgi:hypothetical protein